MDPQQMKDMAGVLWSGAEGRTRITTDSLNTLATAMYEAAEQLAEAPRWRDVVDELPQEAQEVLFVRGGKTVHGAWIGGIFWHSNQKMAAATWMPLPKPPKVGDGSTAKSAECDCLSFWESHHPECPTLRHNAALTGDGPQARRPG